MKKNDNLQKQYDKLTARERTVALVAALVRGDTQEADALSESAPRKTFEVVHHVNEIEALMIVSFAYTVNQLAEGLRLTLLFLWSDETTRRARKRRAVAKAESERINAARISAYKLCELAQAWNEFCEGLGIVPEDAVSMTGATLEHETLVHIARALCPERDEAVEIWAQRGGGDMPTRERYRETLQSAYDKIAHRWDGKGET